MLDFSCYYIPVCPGSAGIRLTVAVSTDGVSLTGAVPVTGSRRPLSQQKKYINVRLIHLHTLLNCPVNYCIWG